jgi:transposase
VLQGRVVGENPGTVGAWRARFAEDGLKKLGSVKPERGRKPLIPESKIQEIVEHSHEEFLAFLKTGNSGYSGHVQLHPVE